MAIDNTAPGNKKSKSHKIKGTVTDITISASTYDTLVAKKPLCETVTKSCVNVAEQVWDTFLKEVAPQIKSAELIAEDNARQSCIGNISDCFQKACKDNIDPNDPDGSYDMCLTRPGSMLNLCKIPLNACGIDASSEAKAQQSDIWDFVVARLAAMRVDACTTEVKNCLQSDDRCGKDYSNCVGLDLAALQEMCPLEKLVSCQREIEQDDGTTHAATWDDIANIVRGIWLGIDNAMLDQCTAIVDEKMIELCGDVSTCLAFEEDKDIGTESLLSYSDNDGNYVIEGLISFGNVKVEKTKSTDDDVKFGKYELNINDYKSHLEDTDPATARVVSALQSTANKINQKIAILSQDPKIKMCVEGRDMSQIRGRESQADSRFPYLLDSSIMTIISSGLEQANKNYTKKYNDLLGKAMESKDDSVKAILCASMASNSEPECIAYSTSLFTGEAICREYQPRSFENIFKDSENVGMSGDDIYSTKYVIPGAKLSDIAREQQKGHSEFNQVDERGNMVGKIAMSAVYSADNNTCTITTTTTMCETMKEIITTQKSTSCGSGGLSILGGGGCGSGGGVLGIGGGKKKTVTTQTFEGVACTKFMEPTTTTTTIKM